MGKTLKYKLSEFFLNMQAAAMVVGNAFETTMLKR